MSHDTGKDGHAAVHISENRKSINIDETESSTSILSVQVRKRSHTSEQFIRFIELTDDGWEDRSNFLWCCTLMGTGNDIFPMMLEVLLTHSGGVHALLFTLFMVLFGLPMVYMELFLGRYTRLTNCQMYRMAPIFFGFCLLIFLMNMFYQPLHVVEDTRILANLLQLLVNPDVNEKCIHNVSDCYDYKIKGSLANQTCQVAHLALICNGKTIRYPMQYQYWYVYKNTASDLYPYWQLVTAVVLSWGIIMGVIMKGVKVLGKLVKTAFIFHISILTVLLLLALLNGGILGFKLLFSFDVSNVSLHTIAVMIWVISFRLGLIIPSGFMTFSAYAKFESNVVTDSAMIVLGSNFLNFYYLVVYSAIAGVIATALKVDPSAVVILERGIFLIMVPEMLVYLETSNFLLVCYYTSSWLFEILKIALYIHMLILNMYDYFPLTKNFETYIWVISSIFLCFLSILFCHQHIYIYFMPIYWTVFLFFGLGLLVAIEGIMVFYIYGVSRLCDDIYFTTGESPSKFWKIMWYTIPAFKVVLGIFMITTVRKSSYGKWILLNDETTWIYCGMYIGSLIAIAVIGCIMLIAIKFDTPNLLLYLIKPQFFWGPIDIQARKSRKTFHPHTYIRSQPTIKSDYDIPDQDSSKNDPECNIENILNDKMFFTNIGIYSDIIELKSRRTVESIH